MESRASISGRYSYNNYLSRDNRILRMKLACCLAAARGEEVKELDSSSEGWSPAYESIVELRRELEENNAQVD